ncbi:MAG: hypothetical protein ABSB63_05280 [Spirochaetia bacterium]
MESRIKIKMGSIEVEYEGESAFIKKDLLALIKQLADLLKTSGIPLDTPTHGAVAKGGKMHTGITTLAIAKKLEYKSGPDLIMAAAAKLTFVDQNEPFSRKKLLAEMKTASGVFKKSYTNNMSGYLDRLVADGKLLSAGTNTYTIADKEKPKLEAAIA